MKRFSWQARVVVGMAALFATWQGACGAGGDAAADDYRDTGGWTDARGDADAAGWEAADADADADAAADAVDTWLPPEDEEDPDFHAPQGSNRFVYLSNPVGDNVVVIDSSRLTVDLVEVGDTPTELATLGATDAAAVIDSGSNDVAVIRTAPTTGSTVSFEPIAPGPNAISVSPDGRYGITYYDVDARRGPRPPNMQEVTLLVFGTEAEQASLRTTVRSLPVDVDWTSDGEQAFVIGRDGLTIIDFGEVREGYRPRHVGFGTVVDPEDPWGVETPREVDDVDIDGFGTVAVLSTADAAELIVLDLASGDLNPVALPAVPTDIDLAEDGTFALAALRESRQVARIELTDPEAPGVFVVDVPGVIVGQVVLTPDGTGAVIFTSVRREPPVETIALLDMATGNSAIVPLEKEVRAVAVTPDGDVAVVIHHKKDGDPNDPWLDPVRDRAEIIDRIYGFSLVRFSDRLVVLQETPCDPDAWLVYPDARKAYITLRDDRTAVREVLVADLEDFISDTVRLGSPPASLGVAPLTRKVFVGQDHPNGRITFIDSSSGSVQTVTGFELNDWIVE